MARVFSELKDFITSLHTDGSFARNFVITFSGNSIAVLVGFLFTPFIARIYTPEAYGLFALFSAIALNISQFSTLQLTRGFVIPKQEQEYLNLVRATISSTGLTLLVATIIVFLFTDTVLRMLNSEALGNWIYVIPVALLLYSINDILKSKNIREKVFTRNAANQIFSSATSRTSTLVYGLAVSSNFSGLILGDLLSKVFEGFVLAGSRIFRFGKQVFINWSWRSIYQTLVAYKSYPIFVLPGVWLLSFSIQLPIYFLNAYFHPSVAGYYSFANSLLNIPIAVLAASMSQVFLQKASETYHNDPKQMPRIVKQLIDRLYLVGLIPISFLMVFGDLVFKYVMGEQWTTSGIYARFMGLYFIFQIINFPLLTLFRIYKKEYLTLLTTSLLIIVNVGALFIGKLYENPLYSIILYCISNMIIYLINIRMVFSFVGLIFYRQLLIWFGLLVVSVGLFTGMRIVLEYFTNSI